MSTKELWTEKYRPTTLDGYVFRDNHQKQQIENWINDGFIPHIILSGSAGVGKTSLAKILFNQLNIHPHDIKEINASRTNSVDDIRDTIVKFITNIPFGEYKVVLLDEADYLSLNAQAVLRGVMEEYQSIVRFIFTCNYPNKIINPIHSRCQGFHIEKVDQTEFTARVATILISENIEFDLDILDTIVKTTYPDLRKCINMVQMNSSNGVLQIPHKNDNSESDYKLEMVQLFKSGKINAARKLLCSQARPEEMVDIYRWLYDNINIFGDEQKQEDAILIIKDGLVNHTIISDPEINLSSTLINLSRL